MVGTGAEPTFSSQISRQYGVIDRGQLALNAPSQTRPSSTMQGERMRSMRPVCSSMMWSTRALLVGFYNRLQDVSNRKLPPKLRWKGGRRWGALRGRAVKTPTVQTGLQPGDLVRIKSKHEIEETLNANMLNRGMGFDSEMGRFCGRTARVVRRVNTIVDENTGRMLHMKSPCIVLEGLVCEGAFNASCPRSITPYWREIWLEKVGSAPVPTTQDAGAAGVR